MNNFIIKYVSSFLIFIFFFSANSQAEYVNTNGQSIDKPFGDLLKWQLAKKKPILDKIEISSEWKKVLYSDNTNYIIWIGHSTFLIKTDFGTVLTDPVFSRRASPLTFLGPERLINTPMQISELPKIDFITISHNHYDHLDINSLKLLSKKFPDAIFLVPEGNKKLLAKNNISNVMEFNWWEDVELNNFLFTFTPVQHWSARGLFDKNKSLWGGWFFKTPSTTFFHAGDSGYSNDFKLINKKLGGPDVAFIPIGAYDPEWFMSASHMNPEEAIQASNDLGAKINYAMHWGTFVLTSEDTLEPPQRIRAESLRLKKSNFKIVMPGQVSFFIN